MLEDGTIVSCRVRGKMKLEDLKTTNPIAVGSYVLNMELNGKVITEKINVTR